MQGKDLKAELAFNLLYIFIPDSSDIEVCDFYKPGQGYLFSDI